MDPGELPEGWVSWEIEPIELGARRTIDERLLGRGRIARSLVVRPALARPAGNAIRRRVATSGIRGAYGLFNRGDLAFLDSAYSEDCEFDFEAFETVGLPRNVKGRSATEEYLSELRDSLGLVYFPGKVIDPGGLGFAGSAEFRITGKSSGVELGAEHWNLWAFNEDGLIQRQRISEDRESILADLREFVG